MMRKLIYVLLALASLSCTETSVEEYAPAEEAPKGAVMVSSPRGALAGVLSVKLSEEVADKVEATQAAVTRAGGVATRSGISEMDVVFDRIGVEHFSRVFPYEEQFEQRHREVGLHRWYSVTFDRESDLREAASLLGQVAGVDVVQFKHRIVSASEGPAIPYTAVADGAVTRAWPMNDPMLRDQWHYNNTGKGSSVSRYPFKEGADISLFDAWKLSTGSSDIVVAVLDEPVQSTHADLKENMWVNPKPGYKVGGQTFNNDIHGFNFWNNTDRLDWVTAAYDEDYKMWVYADHGSHVAGTIAAVNNNGKGVCGIAGGNSATGNGVKIMSCQIMGNDPKNAQAEAAARAFVYAADRGALIAQCSWGYPEDVATFDDWQSLSGGAESDAIDYFIKNAGKDNPNSPLKGGLVVFAAGNSGLMLKDAKTWPAAYFPALAVGAMAPDFRPAYYTDYGDWVNLTAPGGDYEYSNRGMVLSLMLDDPSMTFKDNRTSGYGFMQGTSMACPHVSGVAALGLSYAAKLGRRFTVREYMSLLMTSCDEIDSYFTGTRTMNLGGNQSLTLNMNDYRNKMGAGCINAYKLLLNINGTPSVSVKTGTLTEIDLRDYLSGRLPNVGEVTVKADPGVVKELGLETSVVEGGKLKIMCSKVGSGIVTLELMVGEAYVNKELAIISRKSVAENGSWL